MSKTTDSPRWCATHKTYGDHHTDRCPLTFDDSPEAAERRMLDDARRLVALRNPAPAPAKRSLLSRLVSRR
jgi:hypothetical protein